MLDAQRARQKMVLAPQAVTNGATVTANFDTLGTAGQPGYAEIVIAASDQGSTNATGFNLALSESDDTVVTNFATFDSAFSRNVDDSADAVVRYIVDLRGRKRYLRLSLTAGNGTSSHADDDYTVCAVGLLHDNLIDATGTNDAGDGILIVG